MREYDKLIIIGAARSGTNMLRDVLTALGGVGTWPCDEIPYVWRYGHAQVPHDEFSPRMATEPVRRYIRRAFDRMAFLTGAVVLVEKTCANTLRVGFVDAVFPEARFLYLVRDGVDAVASAMQRWVAPFDMKYSMQKAPFVPLRDLPWYAVRFARNRLHQWRAPDRRLGLWGPVFSGMEEMARSLPLHQVCAHQWQRCVDAAERDLATVDPRRVCRVRYEAFVADPQGELGRVLDFLQLRCAPRSIASAVAGVRATSVGKGRATLSAQERDEVLRIVAPGMERYGYAG